MATAEEINKARADNVSKGTDAYAGAGGTTTNQTTTPAVPQNIYGGGAITNSGIISQNGTTPIKPYPVNAPINSDILKNNPPINLPSATTPTAAVGLPEKSIAYATDAQKSAQAKIDAEKATVDNSAQDITSLITGIGGQDTKKIDAYAAGGLNDKKAQIDSITSDMTAENNKSNLKIQEITQKNPNGVLDTAPEIYRIKQANAFYQANQAVALAGLTGDYNTAKSVIDDRINAETEQLKSNLEAKKFIYDNNSKNWTTDEQRSYEAGIAADTRKYNETVQNKKDIANVQLEAAKKGATAAQINQIGQAKDVSEATQVAASTGVLSTDAITGASTYTPIDPSAITDRNSPNKDWGGQSYNALFNNAKNYLATGGKLPSLGLGQNADVKKAKNAIINYAGQIADGMGLDITQISALYKANAKAASDIIGRAARIETVSNTLTSQIPRLATLADKVKALGITESDIQAGAAKAQSKFGSKDAANYIELIQTIRGDYSAMQASLAGSKGGQYFSEQANEAIPLGLTSEQYLGIKDTIGTSADLALSATGEEAGNLITNPNASIGSTNGTTSNNNDTHVYNGVTYKLLNGIWTPQ